MELFVASEIAQPKNLEAAAMRELSVPSPDFSMLGTPLTALSRLLFSWI
jgi:hypothetical protein